MDFLEDHLDGEKVEEAQATTFRKRKKHLRNPLQNPRKKNGKSKLTLKLVFK